MVNYIGTARVRELVRAVGPARFMEALAREIDADYRRWSQFDKSARHASHSPVGVIELMPTSDGRLRYLHRLNGELGGAQRIDLIPRLADPKDLFGGLAAGTAASTRRAERLVDEQGISA